MTAKKKIVVLAWNYTPINHFTLQNGAARYIKHQTTSLLPSKKLHGGMIVIAMIINLCKNIPALTETERSQPRSRSYHSPGI
jgi:hypothetical protein